MDNIYMLSDMAILARIGENLKSARLKQNITQQSLSEAANVSLFHQEDRERRDSFV